MKWIKERDALIAQTKAFVESVASKTANTRTLDAGPAGRDTPLPTGARPAAPAAPVEAVEPDAAVNGTPLSRRFDQVSMSSEIRARVAAFRAHQERFNRERHDYFNATLARLRASIDDLPPPARRHMGGAGAPPRPDAKPPQSSRPSAGGASSSGRPSTDGTQDRT